MQKPCNTTITISVTFGTFRSSSSSHRVENRERIGGAGGNVTLDQPHKNPPDWWNLSSSGSGDDLQ